MQFNIIRYWWFRNIYFYQFCLLLRSIHFYRTKNLDSYYKYCQCVCTFHLITCLDGAERRQRKSFIFTIKYLRNIISVIFRIFVWSAALVLLIGNVVPAGYLSAVHQKGTIDVMPKLSELAKTYRDEFGKNASVLFLMPCHSTPYYSHVHHNVSLRFLTCEPNFDKKQNYVDEADLFYNEPMKWIRSHLPVHPRSALPTHVVLFDILAPKISDFLSIYKPLEIYFHADVSTSDRIGKNVMLYERIDPTQKIPEAKEKTDSPTKKVESINTGQNQFQSSIDEL